MISIGRAPYRISLLGGGSDLDWFIEKEIEGFAIGYSLNRYNYSIINFLDDYASSGILNYSSREVYENIEDIVHPLIKEVLKSSLIKKYIELNTYGFASGGSGLGGSSCFILSLLAALKLNKIENINPIKLAYDTCEIEISKLNKPIGRQDQYISALGGISCLHFIQDKIVKIINLEDIQKKVLKRIINNLYLVPSFKTRSADKVLSSLKNQKSSYEKIKEIREIARRYIFSDEQNDFKNEQLFHECVRESWEIKKTMTNVMDTVLEDQYEYLNKIVPNNWIRLLGAGSGGYFLISPKVEEKKLIEIFHKSKVNNFIKAELSNEGVSAIDY